MYFHVHVYYMYMYICGWNSVYPITTFDLCKSTNTLLYNIHVHMYSTCTLYSTCTMYCCWSTCLERSVSWVQIPPKASSKITDCFLACCFLACTYMHIHVHVPQLNENWVPCIACSCIYSWLLLLSYIHDGKSTARHPVQSEIRIEDIWVHVYVHVKQCTNLVSQSCVIYVHVRWCYCFVFYLYAV